MKRLTVLFLILSICLQTAFAEEDISRFISHYNAETENYVPQNKSGSDTVFADLIGFEWAHQSIYALAAENIVSGRAKGVFAPGDNVKIKEFIKLLVLVCGVYDEEAESDFLNLDKNDWSYHYISSAKKSGILDFLENSTDFDAYITREQMAVMCAKALEFSGFESKGGYDVLFADDDQIEYQNKRYIYALKNLQIVSGMGDGSFLPKQSLRRCDSAVIIYKVQNLIKNSF